jgi:lycopene beta-cyclase
MGCAGLSLAIQLKRSSIKFERVLLIDRDLKNKNDRTWCFWTKEQNNWFDGIVYKKWDYFEFKTNSIEKKFALAPYQYMMVRGIDFYEACLTELRSDPRFEIVTASIESIRSESDTAVIETSEGLYTASYVFNSAIRVHAKKEKHTNYVQHFKGLLIETNDDRFDEACPVFMDFSVQQKNDCRFVYIIPYSKRKALIEYTGFSKQAVSDEEYDAELVDYIENKLQIKHYKTDEIERGEIPMAESEFVNPFGNKVINIGTAGGFSKASTGYTFYFIQHKCAAIIKQLELALTAIEPINSEKRFVYYDRILLDVIDQKKIAAKDVFEALFTNNKITTLLAFLNEESSLVEDLKIMNSVPKLHFVPSAFKKLIK